MEIINNIISFLQQVTFQDILNFINNPPEQGILLYVKTGFIIISIILLGAFIPLFLVASWMKYYARDAREFMTFRPFNVQKSYKEWDKITKRLESGKETEYKLAVIEADGMLEEILEKSGYAGDLMEERLEKVDSAILSNKEQILKAHKTRNNVVHNADYELTLDEAKKTVAVFEEALRSLEAF